MTGTWKKTGKNTAELMLAGKKYNGVFLRQWDSVREKNVMTFSVLNGSGEAVWDLNKMEKRLLEKALFYELY